MNSFVHTLENDLTKLTIYKKQTDNKNTPEQKLFNINDTVLLPINTDKITALNLSNCNLTELPKWFTFNHLNDVDISYNQFEAVPQLIYNNKKIHTLNISNNRISDFDMKPKCCSHLLDLNVSNNCLKSIPCWIYSIHCDDLRNLKLSNNPFMYQVQLLGRYLKSLKSLELNNANVRLNDNKNRFLMEIPALEKLHLSNVSPGQNVNFIRDLSFEHFAFGPFLKELHLTGLGISIIPEDFIILENLELLNLNKNYITWFPSNFTRLVHLKVLIVSENDLVSLPFDIGKLIHLQELYISDNSVGSLPASITNLDHLKTLDCYNNDFAESVVEILDRLPSLDALDFEQNPFQMKGEVYCRKRDKLRTENRFIARINGPKISDLKEENDNDYDSSSSSNYSEHSFHEDWKEMEPENWDSGSEHSISDDMDLILPKYQYFLASRRLKCPNFRDVEDPVLFEDVSDVQ